MGKRSLTKPAAKELYSHGNVTAPCFGINTHVTCLGRAKETMDDDEISFEISRENLQERDEK